MMQLKELYRQNLWIGVGCNKGISLQLINTAIETILHKFQLEKNQIVGIATIDTKSSEPALVEFCQLHNLPLKTFTASLLSCVCVPHPSPITQQAVNTPSVAEAAAILAAAENNHENVTLLVPKQIFHQLGEKKALTMAIAQCQLFFTQQPGENS
jgi:cobalt-precorrin 5A hydrolase